MLFSLALYIAYQSFSGDPADNPMPTFPDAFFRVIEMSLGTFGKVWDGLEQTNHNLIGKVRQYPSTNRDKSSMHMNII